MITSKWNSKKKILEIVYTGEIDTTQMRESFEKLTQSKLLLDLKAMIYIRTSDYLFHI